MGVHHQQLGGAAGQVPGQVGLVHQVLPTRRPSGRRNVALLMGTGIEGHAQGCSQRPSLSLTHQEAGHVRPLHFPGLGGGAHGPDFSDGPFGPQRLGHQVQTLDVLKHRLALTQTQGALLHRQETAVVYPHSAVKHRRRGGIVAGVKSQTHSCHPCPLPRCLLVSPVPGETPPGRMRPRYR